VTVGISATVANANLNRYRNTAAAAVAAVYVKLHIGDPTTGIGSPATGSTTRNAVTWNAASGGSMTLATLGAWTNGGATETLSHVSLWDDPTAGNFLQAFALSASQAWVSTNTFTITTFTVSISPIAA
jgi:hypothetical protein